MLVGRNFWKSLLLKSEKSEISLSLSKFVISLVDLMAHFCAFPLRCFLAFWIAWKWSSLHGIWLFSLSWRASTFVDFSLGNSTELTFGTWASRDRVQCGIYKLKKSSSATASWQILVELEFLNSGRLLYIF